MFISQVYPAPLCIMPYPGETSCWLCLLSWPAKFQLHRALRWTQGAGRSPLTPQEEGTKAPHVFVAPFPTRDPQIGTLGKGGLARNQLLLLLRAVKESMCVPACVCAWAWTEREDEVMIPSLNPGQLTFPWRFLIKANVCPTKKASLGGWHLISSKNTHRHTSQIKAIYYLLKRLSGIHSPLLASLWPKRPFLICLTGPHKA